MAQGVRPIVPILIGQEKILLFPVRKYYSGGYILNNGYDRSTVYLERWKIMAKDPVCSAVLDEDTAEFRTTCRHREYFFCTGYCKKKFLENPQKYARLSADISTDHGGASCEPQVSTILQMRVCVKSKVPSFRIQIWPGTRINLSCFPRNS